MCQALEMRNGANNIPALILMREETIHKASQVCRQLQGQIRDKCNEKQNKLNQGVRGGMKALLDVFFSFGKASPRR